MNRRFFSAVGVVMVASGLNYFGDRLLGVKLELFSGISTFSFAWVLDLFLLPFLIGMLVSWLYGNGGRWLSYLPPLIVRSLSYAQILYFTGKPHGSSLIPLGWWGLFVILAVESCSFGGIIGEVVIRKTYGRSTPQPEESKQASPADVPNV